MTAKKINTTAVRRWKRYTKYTASGTHWLSQIPSHWQLKRLKYVASIQTGLTLGKDYTGRKVTNRPYLRVANVQDGYLDLQEITEVAVPVEDVGRHELRPGDVLMTEGGDFDKLGRGYVWEGQIPGCLHQNHIFSVRPWQEILEPRFLASLLTSSHGKNYFTATSQQTTNLASTNSTKLKNFPLLIPPIEEQRLILAFLDRETARIDALIERKEHLIALLEEKRQAAIRHAVTRGLDPAVPLRDSGTAWIGKIPAHWGVKQLRHLIRPGTMITYGIVQAGPDIPDGIPYIRTSDMAGDELPKEGYLHTSPDIDEAYRRSRVREGDIVVAIRATVGKALPVPHYLDGANLTQGTAKISPADHVDRDYLLWALRASNSQQRFEALGKGATFREITLDMLRRFAVAYPPLDEQRRIATHLNRLSEHYTSICSRIQDGIARLHEYRTALISAAVTGQIDVRHEVAP